MAKNQIDLAQRGNRRRVVALSCRQTVEVGAGGSQDIVDRRLQARPVIRDVLQLKNLLVDGVDLAALAVELRDSIFKSGNLKLDTVDRLLVWTCASPGDAALLERWHLPCL